MYRRIEVRGNKGLWWGPMSAFTHRRDVPHSYAGVILDTWDGLPGTFTFGREVRHSSRFAWTDTGWEQMGQDTLALCRKVFDSDSVRVRRLSGNVVYQDEYQVAIQPE